DGVGPALSAGSSGDERDLAFEPSSHVWFLPIVGVVECSGSEAADVDPIELLRAGTGDDVEVDVGHRRHLLAAEVPLGVLHEAELVPELHGLHGAVGVPLPAGGPTAGADRGALHH